MNLEELRKQHEELFKQQEGGGQGGDFLNNFFKPEKGMNLIRVLPWKDSDKSFFARSAIHRITDVTGKVQNYHCRAYTASQPCPICELVKELWERHRALNLPPKKRSKFGNLASQIKAVERFYMNCVSKDAEDPQPKILSVGKKVFQKVFDGVFDVDLQDEADTENTTVISLEKGNDFKLVLKVVGGFNNYDDSGFRPKKSAAGTKKQHAEWMESLHDIHTLVKDEEYDRGKELVQAAVATLSEPQEGSEGKSDDSDGGTSLKDYLDKMEN
jgi:hypothetical protein